MFDSLQIPPAAPADAGRARDEVAAALKRGATLLTPNLRSARYWTRTFDAAMRSAGRSTWDSPNILPWRAWTASLWNFAILCGADDRVLLNDVQEHALWERIIKASGPQTLWSVSSQARLCASALHLLGQYDLTHRFAREISVEDTHLPDAAVFAGWFATMEETCGRERLLPSGYLEVELRAAVRSGRLPSAEEHVLWCFPTMTPAQLSLLQVLEETGVRIATLTDDAHTDSLPALVECSTPHNETQRCARFVRDWLQSHASATSDPGAAASSHATIVVPDLQAIRSELERDLRAVIAPEAADVTRTALSGVYELSVGRPLDRLPMIADALRLLRWCTADVSIDDAGSVLRSPYLRLAPSPERGAELDLHTIRKVQAMRGTLSLGTTARRLESLKEPGTVEALRSLASAARELQRVAHTYAECADGTRQLLQDAGWPGGGDLNSEEFQAVDRWNETLDRLATLDLLGRPVALLGFVEELSMLAGETVFAPENNDSPVQVVTMSEALGTPSDLLWFLHADENTWPAQTAPHPLLPWHVQKSLGMPGLSPERDEQASAHLLDVVARGAARVMFSFAGETEHGVQQPSALIARLAEGRQVHGTSIGIAQVEEELQPLLQQSEDTSTIPLLQSGAVSGGVGVLTAQGQCGFRAFAEKRLFTTEMEAVEAGQNPRVRGEQVHKVLELFWSKVRTQKELIALGEDRRGEFLRECIAQVIGRLPDEAWDAAYLQVQRERLFRLLGSWLEVEAGRPPFTVEAIEMKVSDAPIGPLRLQLRVDRIDRMHTDDGDGIVLIDYKTGRATPNDWLGDRPDQPQLPVYAVAGANLSGIGQVDGLAFGSVRIGAKNMKLDGLAESPLFIGFDKKKSVDFRQQVETWKHDLEALATAFANGDADVAPKEYPGTCDRCTQRILCRLNPALLLQPDDLVQDDENEVPVWS